MKKTCSECKGSGSILVIAGLDYITEKPQKNYYTCENCNGTGEIEDKIEDKKKEVK